MISPLSRPGGVTVLPARGGSCSKWKALISYSTMLRQIPAATALFLALTPLTLAQTSPRQTYAALPQAFEPEPSQPGAYTSHGLGYSLSVTPTAAYMQLDSSPTPEAATERRASSSAAALRLTLDGANPAAPGEALEPQSATASYFIGSDPALWRTGVPQFARVRYRNVYPGIDVVWYGNRERLEYDFVLAPHADPNRIVLSVEGPDRVQIDPSGDLVLSLGGAAVRERKPILYQDTLPAAARSRDATSPSAATASASRSRNMTLIRP